jgi:hypothetical protein
MSDALSAAYERAVKGDTRALYDLLTRGSGLPGPRANQNLVDAFAEETRSRGAEADRLIAAMAALDADQAPGASALEFIPMCGVAGIGARAAADDRVRDRMISALHDRADDLRFRVRDEVVASLARVGARTGEALASDLSSWMDGYFHAAAVVRALTDTAWLSQIASPDRVLARLDDAFALLKDAPRSAARYPGHKALVEALHAAPGVIAARFGVPVFDMLERWSREKDPALREIVSKSLGGSRLAGRYAAEVKRVRAALESTEPERRDPRTYVGPTRGRGKKRGRGG